MAGNEEYCTACKVNFRRGERYEHARTEQHRFNYIQIYYTTNRKYMLTNKGGIKIGVEDPRERVPVPDYVGVEEEKIVMYVQSGHSGIATIFVHNKNKVPVHLLQIEPLYKCDRILLDDRYGVCHGATKLNLDADVSYKVTYKAIEGPPCVQELPLVFEFQPSDGGDVFYILKILVIEVLDDISVAQGERYQKDKKDRYFFKPPRPHNVIKGPRMKGQKPFNQKSFDYYYPEELRILVSVAFNPLRIADKHMQRYYNGIRDLMNQSLRQENYKLWWQIQLWLEEIQKEIDFTRYVQSGVKIEFGGKGCDIDLVTLKVPGLEEKRPSLIEGDSVFVRPAGMEAPIYEGVIRRIHLYEEKIHIAFAEEFSAIVNEDAKFDIQFWFNRAPFVRCHETLNHIRYLNHVLFPDPTLACNEEKFPDIHFFDERVRNNEEQKQAVKMIVNEISAPCPYILFGPPGTGKTLTMVEAIKQVYQKHQDSNILVCGPSNASCDILAQRLLTDINYKHLIRVYATSKTLESVPTDLRHVIAKSNDKLRIPSLDEIESYRIVVCTFLTAARVFEKPNEGSPLSSKFSHIFLDECGQGQEVEALVPLRGHARMVVLAGDPKQLGPIVGSKYCLTNGKYFRGAGLDQSLLERLMEREPYKSTGNGRYNERFVTKLVKNFRSHEKILEVSNNLFYESQLVSVGSKSVIDSMLNFKYLPNKKAPIMFVGVNGRDNREEKSPSYFNTHEVSKVIKYIDELVNREKVRPIDIGIVAPYRAQIHKINDALRALSMRRRGTPNQFKDIKVGSPEQFQGDERKIIVVSTVRAGAEFLLHDDMMQLGFLRNPKRFNVAVTRAQALLIIIGCPWVLARDLHWGQMLRHLINTNCYRGCSLNTLDIPTDVDDIYKAYENLNIDVEHAELED